jgi:hypothetical protein
LQTRLERLELAALQQRRALTLLYGAEITKGAGLRVIQLAFPSRTALEPDVARDALIAPVVGCAVGLALALATRRWRKGARSVV